MRYYSNTAAATTLENSGGITPTSTQLILANTTGYPTQFPFTLRLEPDTPNEELVTVNSGAGSAGSPYIVSRGSDGTTAKSHAQFSPVTHGFSARDLREPQEHIADTWVHVRRPLFAGQKQEFTPTAVGVGAWTNFSSAVWSPITFTSPPSGIVEVTISAQIENDPYGIAIAYRMSGGRTINIPGDDITLKTDAGAVLNASRNAVVTGLTPGVSTTITPAWFLYAGPGANPFVGGGQLKVELWP